MKWIGWIAMACLLGSVGMQAGCRDNTPPPPNVPVPTADDRGAQRERDEIKPLPDQYPVERSQPPQ